ncbi:Tat-linked quality control protein TatD [Anoxybacillus sp. BCO1]|nr:Tat-linked quality control protein TatD [Anoxybacillus sp. BCO1]
MLFDTHAHLNATQFNEDVEQVIERARAESVSHIVVVGFDRPTIQRAMELAEQYSFIYAAVGWHPVDAIHMTDEDLIMIERLAAHPKVVALGEMGLDYYWINHRKTYKRKYFENKFV